MQHEAAFLEALPSAAMYEKSYMHREHVTHTAVAAAAEFFFTASTDGHLKFWKKKGEGIEFVKTFRAHLGPVTGVQPVRGTSLRGSPACTVVGNLAVGLEPEQQYQQGAAMFLVLEHQLTGLLLCSAGGQPRQLTAGQPVGPGPHTQGV